MTASPDPASRDLANQVLAARCGWLRDLADSLELASAALIHQNLGALRYQTGRQQDICRNLLQSGALAPPDLSLRDPGMQPELQREMAQLANLVARRNRTYAALLRRARRTVNIFCRVLEHAAVTYPEPGQALRIVVLPKE